MCCIGEDTQRRPFQVAMKKLAVIYRCCAIICPQIINVGSEISDRRAIQSKILYLFSLCYSSKNHSVLLTACCFRVHLRPFTKQPTGREDTLRVPYHLTRRTHISDGSYRNQGFPSLPAFHRTLLFQTMLLFPCLMTLHEHSFGGCSVTTSA